MIRLRSLFPILAALALSLCGASAATYTNDLAPGSTTDLGSGQGVSDGGTIALQWTGSLDVQMQAGAGGTWVTVYSSKYAGNKKLDIVGATVRLLVPVSATGNSAVAASINTASSGGGGSVPTGTAGSPNAAVVSMQGVSGGTPVPVSISSGGGTTPTGSAGSPNAAVISVQGIAGGTAQAVSGPAGAAVVVDGSAVAQPTIGYAVNPSGSFTRPANITAYAAGYLVANSTTAGSVTPVSLTAGRVSAGSFMLRRVKVHKTGTSTTNAGFRVHLFRAAPTVANGDGATNSMTGVANYLGAFDVTVSQVFTDGAAGFGGPNSGQDMTVKLASGTTVYALVEALGAYSPVSGETFTITLEDLQN